MKTGRCTCAWSLRRFSSSESSTVRGRRAAGDWKQGSAGTVEHHRADRKSSVCAFAGAEISVSGGHFLRAGDLVLYGGGTGDLILEKSADPGWKVLIIKKERTCYVYSSNVSVKRFLYGKNPGL